MLKTITKRLKRVTVMMHMSSYIAPEEHPHSSTTPPRGSRHYAPSSRCLRRQTKDFTLSAGGQGKDQGGAPRGMQCPQALPPPVPRRKAFARPNPLPRYGNRLRPFPRTYCSGAGTPDPDQSSATAAATNDGYFARITQHSTPCHPHGQRALPILATTLLAGEPNRVAHHPEPLP